MICIAVSSARSPSSPLTTGGVAVSHRTQERLDLSEQRIALLERVFFDRHLRGRLHRRGIFLANHRQDLLLQVDRQVGVVLEDAQLALLLHADPAGRGVGDAAAVKADARVDDVDLAGEHTRTDSIDALDGCADQLLDEVDVVDHEIEHDADVGAAQLERREPVRLDEAQLLQTAGRGQDRRIETFEVADLQRAVVNTRDVDELARLGNGGRDGLLDEHVNAVPEQRAADRMMQWSRHREADCVDLVEDLAIVADSRHAKLRTDSRRGRGIRIDHRDQPRLRELCVFLRVKASEIAHADHGRARWSSCVRRGSHRGPGSRVAKAAMISSIHGSTRC